MKNYLYVCGLTNDDGMYYIKPLFANSQEDAMWIYVELLKNDKDFPQWKHEFEYNEYNKITDHTFINKDGYYYSIGFLSVTPELLSPDTKKYFNEYFKHYGKI